MSNSLVTEIEDSFTKLSVSEQRLLLERLARRVSHSTDGDVERQLAAMASDPQIQAELERID
jgi:hypothetical protein